MFFCMRILGVEMLIYAIIFTYYLFYLMAQVSCYSIEDLIYIINDTLHTGKKIPILYYVGTPYNRINDGSYKIDLHIHMQSFIDSNCTINILKFVIFV